MSNDQLNQKFKLIVEVPGIDLYSITPLHTRALWALALDSMSKDQLNQKFKLIIEASKIDLYSITMEFSCSNPTNT